MPPEHTVFIICNDDRLPSHILSMEERQIRVKKNTKEKGCRQQCMIYRLFICCVRCP